MFSLLQFDCWLSIIVTFAMGASYLQEQILSVLYCLWWILYNSIGKKCIISVWCYAMLINCYLWNWSSFHLKDKWTPSLWTDRVSLFRMGENEIQVGTHVPKSLGNHLPKYSETACVKCKVCLYNLLKPNESTVVWSCALVRCSDKFRWDQSRWRKQKWIQLCRDFS